MPAFDGTGPRGQGPRTGRGFGYCAPISGAYYGQPVIYGVGRGGIPRGGGRGRRFGRAYPFAPADYPVSAPIQMTAADEIAMLKEQSQTIQDQVNQINARIAELSADQG